MLDGVNISHNTPVDSAESVARFTINDGHFAKTKNKVKTPMFSPPGHLRLSVFRAAGLSVAATAALGQAEYGDKLAVPKKVLAWASVSAERVIAQGLNLVPGSAAKPPMAAHPRHADVVGWPPMEGGELARAERMKIAALLAEAASLHCI